MIQDWHISFASAKYSLELDSPLVAGPNALPVKDSQAAESFGAICTPLIRNTVQSDAARFLLPTVAGYLVNEEHGSISWQTARKLYSHAEQPRRKPILATVTPSDRISAVRAAQDLSGWEQTAGILLHLYCSANPHETADIIQAIVSNTELPLLVRLPFEQPDIWLATLCSLPIAGLVVAAPPNGRLRNKEGAWEEGDLHSPALVAHYAGIIARAVGCGIPLIARADASSIGDVLTLVAAGAEAVMLEGALWTQPNLAERILSGLHAAAARAGAGNWQEFTRYLRREQPDAPDQSG
ncbi:MAG: hypothetical protein LLG44_10725 [Chloroflexi bacterium]|nr:hypothetical protein [Chloroflexota bacterium]